MPRATNKIEQTKKALLTALEKNLGIVTPACKEVGIGRTTFYKYIKDDPEFAQAVKDTENAALDFAESSLFKQIKAGVPSSTIFYLKTKGKHRGYTEKSELAINSGEEMSEKEIQAAIKKLSAVNDKYAA